MSVRITAWRAWPVLLVAAFWGLAGAPLSATSYVMVSDAALVDAAPLVVVGRIVSVDRSARLATAAGPALATGYGVAVEERLKGDPPAGTLRVHVPGGMGADGIGLKIYGAPRFRLGERALFFLEPDRRGAAGTVGNVGNYRLAHFFLGAFHEVPAGAHRLAVRNLSEASEMRVTAAGVAAAAPRREPLRDFAAFSAWVRVRAAGEVRQPDYLLADGDGSLRRIAGKFSLFEDPDDHKNLRWFDFDAGGNVPWKAHVTGQVGLAGGGYAEFQTGLTAWNAEAQTPIDYRYDGTTASTNGLETYDTLNTIVFNDPTDILPAFNCAAGGVLAVGGPWYEAALTTHQGKAYHRILNADIVINDGIGCFFTASETPSKAAQELFGHELGHTLGLAHSCGDAGGPDAGCTNPVLSDALMRAFVHDDGRGARLNSDDQAGVEALYKAGASGQPPKSPARLAATPVNETKVHLAWHDKASDELEDRIEVAVLGGEYADAGGVPADSTEADVEGLTPATGYTFRVRARNANGYSGYSNEAIAATFAPLGACVADAQTLCLNKGRFRAEADWKTPAGDLGMGNVVVTSESSGLLSFFDPGNYEVIVKVLNGCSESIPGYWVFLAGATNVQYVVTVTDTQTGAVKAYFNPLNHSAAAVTETGAFATCP